MSELGRSLTLKEMGRLLAPLLLTPPRSSCRSLPPPSQPRFWHPFHPLAPCLETEAKPTKSPRKLSADRWEEGSKKSGMGKSRNHSREATPSRQPPSER